MKTIYISSIIEYENYYSEKTFLNIIKSKQNMYLILNEVYTKQEAYEVLKTVFI